jgi:CNT family concentrative nucleoside transporter
MNVPTSGPAGHPPAAPPVELHHPPMPFLWRVILLAGTVLLGLTAWYVREPLGPQGQAAFGAMTFFCLAAACSANLRAVNWRTIVLGIVLQLILALLVIKARWTFNGADYSVYAAFDRLGYGVKKFISFSDEGARFVFGNLANPGDLALNPGKEFLFMFAFKALPPILFVSAFFTVLYHYGVLQWVVRAFAKVMVYLLGTSGAETLSVSANVFMGQTEAPLIVKPYVPRMTRSELFTLMVSGMAHISGGMMAVYINYGADPVAVLTTCIMACPCSLYLAKLILPERGVPETSGMLHKDDSKSPYVNGIDAAAAGTADGLRLALNVAAMLIVFIAFIAMFDGLLALVDTRFWMDQSWWPSAWQLPETLSLRWIFGQMFAPAAMLMGVDPADQHTVGSLLGAKLSINEHFAYLEMKKLMAVKDAAGNVVHPAMMSARSFKLAAFALTGFANFSSIGIQIGGIGAIAPDRRHDLARLGGKALFAGFLATLLNAAVAGALMSDIPAEPH